MSCLHGLGLAWHHRMNWWSANKRVCRLCGLVQERRSYFDIGIEFETYWESVGYAKKPKALIAQWRGEKQQKREEKRATREAEEKRLRSNIIRADHDHNQKQED